jgi:hypothetical protein
MEAKPDVKFLCINCQAPRKGRFAYCSKCRATTGSRAIPSDCSECGKPRHLTKDDGACCAFCNHDRHNINNIAPGVYQQLGAAGNIQDQIAESAFWANIGFRDDLKGQSILYCQRCNFQDTRPLNASRQDAICRLCGWDNAEHFKFKMPKKHQIPERNGASMVNPIAFASGNVCPKCATVWHVRNGAEWCDSCNLVKEDIIRNMMSELGLWGHDTDGQPPCEHLIALRQTIEALDLSLVGSIASHAVGGSIMVWCHQCARRYAVQLAHPFIDANNKATCNCQSCQRMKANG